MLASVIISTYNSPEWLEKVLIGFSTQTIKDFEVIVADDGSNSDTAEIIDQYRSKLMLLKHIWHEDIGFRKCEILNKAILASKSDYLLFTDGDCIPRKDFVQNHLENRAQDRFLSGGYFKLPMSLSKVINSQNILNQDCFSIQWLKENGLPLSFKNLKLAKNKFLLNSLNTLTPTRPSWNGHNSSGWKKDIIKVNGFDERMKYGGEDRELGERLENNKIHGKQIRYKAICVHLDHKRSYVNDEDWQNNNLIRKQTKTKKSVWTNFGIQR